MYYPVAFATSGDQTAIPNTGTELGTINFTYGYGSNYSASLTTDPDAKRVDRQHSNYLMYTMTANWQALYQTGSVPWITDVENLGTPFPYALNAIVQYSDGKIYFNTVADNVATPGDPASGWQQWQPMIPVTVTASPVSSAVCTAVVANGGSLMTIPLPAAANDGDTFQVSGVGVGGWLISQAAGQQILGPGLSTTIGVTGTLASSNRYDDVTLRYYDALGNWKVIAVVGNLTPV